MLEEEQVLVCTGWLVLKCRTSPPFTAGDKYLSVLVLKLSVVQAPPCTG